MGLRRAGDRAAEARQRPSAACRRCRRAALARRKMPELQFDHRFAAHPHRIEEAEKRLVPLLEVPARFPPRGNRDPPPAGAASSSGDVEFELELDVELEVQLPFDVFNRSLSQGARSPSGRSECLRGSPKQGENIISKTRYRRVEDDAARSTARWRCKPLMSGGLWDARARGRGRESEREAQGISVRELMEIAASGRAWRASEG